MVCQIKLLIQTSYVYRASWIYSVVLFTENSFFCLKMDSLLSLCVIVLKRHRIQIIPRHIDVKLIMTYGIVLLFSGVQSELLHSFKIRK